MITFERGKELRLVVFVSSLPVPLSSFRSWFGTTLFMLTFLLEKERPAVTALGIPLGLPEMIAFVGQKLVHMNATSAFFCSFLDSNLVVAGPPLSIFPPEDSYSSVTYVGIVGVVFDKGRIMHLDVGIRPGQDYGSLGRS